MPSNWFVCCFFLAFWLICANASIPEELECDKDFAKVGCYKDRARTRAFTNMTNFRGNIDWKNLDAWLKRLACVCASIARKGGSAYFGLQYFGECWTGTKPNVTYDHRGPSRRCRNQKMEPCHTRDVSDDSVICFGKGWANYVYKLTEAPVCEDASTKECVENANKGFCKSYPAVREHCPKSCGLC